MSLQENQTLTGDDMTYESDQILNIQSGQSGKTTLVNI